MKISNIMVGRQKMDFFWKFTAVDRAEYIQRQVARLYRKHVIEIATAGVEPVFYLDRVPSKMNYQREKDFHH